MIDLLLGAWPQILAGLGVAGAFLWTFIAGGKREKAKQTKATLKALERIADVEDSFTVDDARKRLSARK